MGTPRSKLPVEYFLRDFHHIRTCAICKQAAALFSETIADPEVRTPRKTPPAGFPLLLLCPRSVLPHPPRPPPVLHLHPPWLLCPSRLAKKKKFGGIMNGARLSSSPRGSSASSAAATTAAAAAGNAGGEAQGGMSTSPSSSSQRPRSLSGGGGEAGMRLQSLADLATQVMYLCVQVGGYFFVSFLRLISLFYFFCVTARCCLSQKARANYSTK